MFVGTFDHLSDFFGAPPRQTLRSRLAHTLSGLRVMLASDPLRGIDRHMAQDIGIEAEIVARPRSLHLDDVRV